MPPMAKYLTHGQKALLEEREQYRKETEILTILTGLEIDSAKSGVKPELSEYLGSRTAVKSLFLKYKGIAGDPDEHKWHEPSKAKRLKAFFADIEFGLSCKTQRWHETEATRH